MHKGHALVLRHLPEGHGTNIKVLEFQERSN